jgi:hypothetical protein
VGDAEGLMARRSEPVCGVSALASYPRRFLLDALVGPSTRPMKNPHELLARAPVFFLALFKKVFDK